SEGPGVPLPDVGEAVREDAEEQHAALHAGAPRNAIVACWVRLEDAVVSAGLTVRGSETSTELTQRVLATYLVDDAALVRLAALYREARFSRHDITEAMRAEAVEALEELHDGLAIPTRSGGAMQCRTSGGTGSRRPWLRARSYSGCRRSPATVSIPSRSWWSRSARRRSPGPGSISRRSPRCVRTAGPRLLRRDRTAASICVPPG